MDTFDEVYIIDVSIQRSAISDQPKVEQIATECQNNVLLRATR